MSPCARTCPLIDMPSSKEPDVSRESVCERSDGATKPDEGGAACAHPVISTIVHNKCSRAFIRTVYTVFIEV